MYLTHLLLDRSLTVWCKHWGTMIQCMTVTPYHQRKWSAYSGRYIPVFPAAEIHKPLVLPIGIYSTLDNEVNILLLQYCDQGVFLSAKTTCVHLVQIYGWLAVHWLRMHGDTPVACRGVGKGGAAQHPVEISCSCQILKLVLCWLTQEILQREEPQRSMRQAGHQWSASLKPQVSQANGWFLMWSFHVYGEWLL